MCTLTYTLTPSSPSLAEHLRSFAANAEIDIIVSLYVVHLHSESFLC